MLIAFEVPLSVNMLKITNFYCFIILQAIVTEMLGQYNKRLDKEQMSSLLSKNSSQNPLWLAIACEELRIYGEFTKVTDKINSLQDGLLK